MKMVRLTAAIKYSNTQGCFVVVSAEYWHSLCMFFWSVEGNQAPDFQGTEPAYRAFPTLSIIIYILTKILTPKSR